MSDPEFVRDALHEQAESSPAADAVMQGIRLAVARKQTRKRHAWTGATALLVAAAITVPIVALGGRTTNSQKVGAAPPSVPASTQSPQIGPATTQRSASAPVAGQVTQFSRPPRTTATSAITTTPAPTQPSPHSRTPTAPTRAPNAPTTTTGPTANTAAATSRSLLDPNKLPAGLMPKGWKLYGTEGGALLYGVTPTRNNADPIVKLTVGKWSGVSWSTCAGMPARTVDNGGGISHITMKIDSTRAYVLNLNGQPDFTRLTPAQANTVKSIGIDLCGNNMVWNPSDTPLG